MRRVPILSGTPLCEVIPRQSRTLIESIKTTQPYASSAGGWYGFSPTASGTPHTKGDYALITSSLTYEAWGLALVNSGTIASSGSASGVLLDIATGAAASETIIIPNVNYSDAGVGCRFYFPVYIPAGTRLSARIQSSVASKSGTWRLMPLPFMPGVNAFSTLNASLGANTATSRGVVLTNPVSNNAVSDWTEISAATPEAYRAFYVEAGGGGSSAQPSANIMIEIGTGPAGSETILVHGIQGFVTTGETVQLYDNGPFAAPIPKGTRVAARFLTNNITGIGLDLAIRGLR